ncbi:hypothetical protein EYF80_009709 [Liparis tanakae]|uniref:Uncharacterized protein n=1 Tax=Liparis tanakae TaxID=230148 RepID=A0A4Z2IR09_9TELE|nr:hypothetical protein EYF80_009709 [Liparis tanakae]
MPCDLSEPRPFSTAPRQPPPGIPYVPPAPLPQHPPIPTAASAVLQSLPIRPPLMDRRVSNLTSSLSTVFSQENTIERIVEEIKNLGVCSAEDLEFIEADDLAGVQKLIEIRKFKDCIKPSWPPIVLEYQLTRTSKIETESNSSRPTRLLRSVLQSTNEVKLHLGSHNRAKPVKMWTSRSWFIGSIGKSLLLLYRDRYKHTDWPQLVATI